jgi:hypothetical protein
MNILITSIVTSILLASNVEVVQAATIYRFLPKGGVPYAQQIPDARNTPMRGFKYVPSSKARRTGQRQPNPMTR